MSSFILLASRFAHAVGVTLLALSFMPRVTADEPIRVLVWDEQQPAQKEAYDNFLGNTIAEHLRSKPGLQVRSSSIQDGEQGVAPAVLDFAQVIVWWGHVRHSEIKSELGKDGSCKPFSRR